MPGEQRRELGVQPLDRPRLGDADDPGRILAQERAEVLDVAGEDEALLCHGQVGDRYISHPTEVQVVDDVLDIEAFIEMGQALARWQLFVQQDPRNGKRR